MAVLLHNVGENFVTVMSEDDPDLLLGWERVVVFDVLGAVPDDRPETEKDIAAMRARVADEQERIAAEKRGQFRLPDPEGNEVATVTPIDK
jgi:hypothetical protein